MTRGQRPGHLQLPAQPPFRETGSWCFARGTTGARPRPARGREVHSAWGSRTFPQLQQTSQRPDLIVPLNVTENKNYLKLLFSHSNRDKLYKQETFDVWARWVCFVLCLFSSLFVPGREEIPLKTRNFANLHQGTENKVRMEGLGLGGERRQEVCTGPGRAEEPGEPKGRSSRRQGSQGRPGGPGQAGPPGRP